MLSINKEKISFTKTPYWEYDNIENIIMEELDKE